jgi:hypothetical protein
MEFSDRLYKPQRLPSHRLRGELWLGSTRRVISHRLNTIIPLIQCELPILDIVILDVTKQSVAERGAFLAYHYSKFFITPGQLIPQQEEIAAAMLGLLLNVVDYSHILSGNNELNTHCEKAGFIPIFRIVRSEDN